ncbi:MAG: hypothetical protein ACKVXR_02655 [Planctomycetota bacterium]
MEFDKEVLRWVVLIGATPIWIPFLFTLWRDFNDALRLDGGLLGSPPTGRKLEAAQRELAEKPDVLVSEPIVQPGDRKRPRLASSSRRAPASTRREPRFR